MSKLGYDMVTRLINNLEKVNKSPEVIEETEFSFDYEQGDIIKALFEDSDFNDSGFNERYTKSNLFDNIRNIQNTNKSSLPSNNKE